MPRAWNLTSLGKTFTFCTVCVHMLATATLCVCVFSRLSVRVFIHPVDQAVVMNHGKKLTKFTSRWHEISSLSFCFICFFLKQLKHSYLSQVGVLL